MGEERGNGQRAVLSGAPEQALRRIRHREEPWGVERRPSFDGLWRRGDPGPLHRPFIPGSLPPGTKSPGVALTVRLNRSVREPRPPSLAHLRFHSLQRLAAADADLLLVRLEAADDASSAHLHAGAKPRDIRLAVLHRLGLLGERARLRRTPEPRAKSPRRLQNDGCACFPSLAAKGRTDASRQIGRERSRGQIKIGRPPKAPVGRRAPLRSPLASVAATL